MQFVTFRLGKETFAVGVGQVREIGRVEEITHVPKMPDFIEGVMNLRGQITTVIDLRKRIGIDGVERTDQSRIIVAEVGESQLGLVVDSVQDVIKVSQEMISPPPKTVARKVDASFLTGICKLQERLIMLLDLDKVFSDKEMEAITQDTEKFPTINTPEVNG